MVVDDQVHRENPRGRVLAEDRRLHVHQGKAIELVEIDGGDGAHLDPESPDHGEILGPLDLTEGDQRRGRRLATEQRSQGVPTGDSVGVRVGLQQNADLLASAQQLADLYDPVEVAQMGELLIHVVTDQGA
jgi:hypothetical protein